MSDVALNQPMLPPPTPDLRGFVAALGSREAALRLIEARGGTTLYVPRNANRSALVEELGDRVVAALIAEYAGTYVRVPLAKAWRAQILHARGASHAEIARALGMSESGVYRTLRLAGITGNFEAEAAAPTRQLDLGF